MPHPCASTSLPAGTCCLHQGCPSCRCSNSRENGHQEGQGQTLPAQLLQPALQNVQKTAPQVTQSSSGQQHKGCRRWMGLRDLNSIPAYGMKGFLWRSALQPQLLLLHLAGSSPGSCLLQQLWQSHQMTPLLLQALANFSL